tara:strand:- start:562 stop:777 length:216 start_codon:yes stop_codon:yes gene_type:complete
MLFKLKSILTGKTSAMEIDVTQEQLDAWYGGVLIQNAMPHLAKYELEFIKTGITPKEWAELIEPKGYADAF